MTPSIDTVKPPRPAGMPHVPQLDGLRALAVLLVLAAHAGFERIVPGGFGVTIFFFLSGYLITTLMRFEQARTGTVNLRDFYIRRTVRIFPPLYITLSLALLLYATGWIGGPVDTAAVLSQATFLTNYGDLWGPNHGLPLPLWSLAVEEHFYLVFPLLFCIGLGRMGGRRAATLCLLACGVILALRIANVALLDDYSANYLRTHTRLDSILFGCSLALWNNPLVDRDAYRPRLWHAAAAFLVLLACLAIREETFRQTLRYTLQGGALAMLFSWCLRDHGIAARILGHPILARIALYSYTIYLVHPIMFDAVLQARLAVPHVPPPIVSLALTWAYADAMYRLVERPAATLRRRLDQGRPLPRTPPLRLSPAP